MYYPSYKYVDLALGGVDRRNNVVAVNEITIPKPPLECYRTVYRYTADFKQHVLENKSVGGFKGACYADFLPIDIDSEDLNKAHQSAIRLLNNLLNDFEIDLDALRLFFSGAKGFHILIPSNMFSPIPSNKLPNEFKLMALELVNGESIDTSIYDIVRLFRIQNTINKKTGLYKVPLTAGELLNSTVKDITELAKAPRKVTINESSINEYLVEIYKKAQESKKTKPVDNIDATGIKAPREAKLCYYNIMGGLNEGGRDNAGLRLAVHLLKSYPIDIVEPMMQAWNKRNKPPLEEEQISKITKQALGEYDFGCNDGVLKEYCDPKCRFIKREQAKISAKEVYTYDEAKEKYLEYIKQLTQRKITLGFEKLDKCLRGVAPGEVCQLMARTGVGKTAFMLNAIKNAINIHDIPVLFFSLEMPLAQIYERTVQIANSAAGNKVEQEYYLNPSTIFHSKASMDYDRLFVVDRDFLSYEDLKEFVLIAEREKIGMRPPLICVDYLGRMQGTAKDNYSIISELAKQLKMLAKELEVAILYLHQTNRTGKTGQEEISLDMGRDSGVAEEAADFILGMWRPNINDAKAQQNENEEVIIAILKNRKGALARIKCNFTKPTLTISEI